MIITQIISTVTNVNHELHFEVDHDEGSKERLEEGKVIISKLSALKHEMGKNAVLCPIEEDGGDNVECYNLELDGWSDEQKTWFSVNWLFAECYLCVSHCFGQTICSASGQSSIGWSADELTVSQIPKSSDFLRWDSEVEGV